VVTDGGCRDCAFIRRIGFPVFSRYRIPRDVVAAWTPDAFEETLLFGDVSIAPGDYLVGDIDGTVRIPAAIAADVTEEVQRVIATESLVRKAIMAGVDPKEAYLSHGRF
jgi:4-hydroxy-4-methyl-2-oxoglutarate aldolase